MNLSKIYKNTFLIVLLSFVLTACATQKKVTTEIEKIDSQIQGDVYTGTDGKGERLLTENYYQEAPSWSPNGRVLIFYRETKTDKDGKGFSAKLWSIDLTGYNERRISTETDASDPSWSSLLTN